MLAVIGGRTDVVRILTAAGAELCLRGTGTRPSRRNQPSPSLEVTPRWSRSCAPVLHIDPNDKKPAFRNRIFMEGGASEADISTARAGVHCRTTPLIRIHVRDHKLRELSINDRTLEGHYGGFVLSQARKGTDESSLSL